MVKKICKYCHKEFITKYNAKMFCTDYCSRQFHRFGAKQTEFVCEYCGKTFTWDRKKKYCSQTCQDRANNARYASSRMAMKRKKKKKQNFKSIEEINEAARALNLSYGQYMAKLTMEGMM